MINKKLLSIIGIGIVLSIFFFWLSNQRTSEKPPANRKITSAQRMKTDVLPLTADQVKPADRKNWQTGLTQHQILDELRRREAEAGGALQIWKRKLVAVKNDAKTIKSIKITPEAVRFFDKVEKSLTEDEPLVHAENAKIADIVEAKEAYVVYSNQYHFPLPSKVAIHNGIVYFAPPSRAELLPSREHPDGGEIKVPDNFSRGRAIKLDEITHLRLYRWNFNRFPPEDGILGIETEFE
jgi:hypothetical protein